MGTSIGPSLRGFDRAAASSVRAFSVFLTLVSSCGLGVSSDPLHSIGGTGGMLGIGGAGGDGDEAVSPGAAGTGGMIGTADAGSDGDEAVSPGAAGTGGMIGTADAGSDRDGAASRNTAEIAGMAGTGDARSEGDGAVSGDTAGADAATSAPGDVWTSAFTDLEGWNHPEYPLFYADLDGDGREDVCGRGPFGILCGKSDGSSFTQIAIWQSTFSDANGWVSPEYYSTIRFPDVDGDGKADVCGRSALGVICSTSDGSSFGSATAWDHVLGDSLGWNLPRYYSTVAFPDLNGDGKADLCMRGSAGLMCGLSNGSSFGELRLWQGQFSDDDWWLFPEYYKTIRFADIDGDGKADVCGRYGEGIVCATSTGSFFTPTMLWQKDFSDAAGWFLPEYYATVTLADINGDGKADLCGRGILGVLCALSTGSSFVGIATWQPTFGDGTPWRFPQYYESIQFPDIDRDGKADLCARGPTGVSCALSDGTQFGMLDLWDSSLSDAAGWNREVYYKSIKFVSTEKGSRRRLCYRGPAGIICR